MDFSTIKFFNTSKNELYLRHICLNYFLIAIHSISTGSLTLAHSRNSQMSFMYGFFIVKLLFFTVVSVVNVI